MLDLDSYLGSLRTNGNALADTMKSASAQTPVPSCGAWTLTDLVTHLGIHHRWVLGNVDRFPAEGMAGFDGIEPPPDWNDAADWIRAGVDALADHLAEVGLDKPCWTFAGEAVSGFWVRRTAHETEIHGWDGTNAAGAPLSIDPTLASDGIDEWLSLAGMMPSGGVRGDGQTMHVHCTDVEGEWLVRLGTDGLDVTREHAKGDVAVRGPAADLFLVLTRRLTAGSATIELIGDESVFELWYDHAKF
jgi:uncharacterized protein (TIGR03083 family)